MGTYEVSFALETGHTLNVLIAAADEKWALSEAAQLLRHAGVNDGDAYRADEVTVKAVDVIPVRQAA